MTSLRKLERDFARADLAAVRGLIAQLSEEDVMARFGLEARRDELQVAIAAMEALPEETVRPAALFFGGNPVIGTRGIESTFAGSAIGKFQDIVAKVLAHETSGLGQRGVVPNRSASTLHITNVVRGSFGFLLEEVQPPQQLLETSLKTAVDKAAQLLDAFGEPDEEQFRSAVEDIDERLLGTAREFFSLMRQSGATLRLVSGDMDRSFGAQSVERAAERATSTTVEEAEESIRGYLSGVLPESHQFEFRAGGERGIVRGKVDRALSSAELEVFNRQWVHETRTLASVSGGYDETARSYARISRSWRSTHPLRSRNSYSVAPLYAAAAQPEVGATVFLYPNGRSKIRIALVVEAETPRGFASGITNSSMVLPQPQGHRIPTHQSSSPSRANTRSRQGSRVGRLSPLITRRRRRGLTLANVLRRRLVKLMALRSPAGVAGQAGPIEAHTLRDREWGWQRSQRHSPA